MTQPKIVCVTPTCRPESHAQFVRAWTPLFEKHRVTLVTVWDRDEPGVTAYHYGPEGEIGAEGYGPVLRTSPWAENRDLFCRRTDACRNLGFVAAAQMNPDYVLTMDDDCYPAIETQLNPPRYQRYGAEPYDPIRSHLSVLEKRVPLSWMNTAHDTDLYLRGVPYKVRDEAPVCLSHGVWVGTPDFDGETQINLEEGYEGKGKGVPYSLPYFVGPVPKGVLFPLSGMNVMVRKEALPYFYFAPMGPDTGPVGSDPVVCETCNGNGEYSVNTGGPDGEEYVRCDRCDGKGRTGGSSGLNRFSDIWMGVFLKRQFDALDWACVTGYSTVLHTRASDARKNYEQEKLGREWNEWIWQVTHPVVPVPGDPMGDYLLTYESKRDRYAQLIRSIQGAKHVSC